MFARVTLLEIDPLRADVHAALEMFDEAVLPRLREQEGYGGVFVLATPDGKGLLMSLWETQEASERTWAFAGEQLEEHMTLFKAPPGREAYEVVFSESPALAAG